MTVDLKIKVENGIVTITVGGQKLPASSQATQGTVVTSRALGALPQPGSAANQVGPDTGGAPGSGSGVLVVGPLVLSGALSGLGSPQPGSAANQVGPDTGGAPGSGSAVLVIGPIVLTGGTAQALTASAPANVPPPAPPAAQ